MRICKACQLEKAESEFYQFLRKRRISVQLAFDSRCKPCKRLWINNKNSTKRAKKENFLRTKAWRKANPEKVRGYNQSFSARYSNILQRHTKRWHTEPVITLAEYLELVPTAMCHYCRLELKLSGGGLDRIDPAHGYTKENVVPCCWVCNAAKADFFTEAEMLKLGQVIREIKQAREP